VRGGARGERGGCAREGVQGTDWGGEVKEGGGKGGRKAHVGGGEWGVRGALRNNKNGGLRRARETRGVKRGERCAG